jgi:cobalt-zinc-cadmium resistance protein CzcA
VHISKSESKFYTCRRKVKSLDDIENIVVKNRNGTLIVKDVADVLWSCEPFCAITGNGEGEKVLGQVMLKGANSKQVINDVKVRIAEIQKIITRRSLYS